MTKAPSESTTMRATWLVQRLQKPVRVTNPDSLLARLGADNPFAFGGGLKNGGLSNEAMGLLRDIFSFDYMGAAEFEFGAVPKALQAIAKTAEEGSLRAWSFDIALSAVPKPWRDKSDEVPTGKATLYVLCRQEDKAEVKARVSEMACKEYGLRLKEMPHLAGALRPDPEYPTRTCGWLELDNGFMFFTDREMWEQTAALFGLEAPDAQP